MYKKKRKKLLITHTRTHNSCNIYIYFLQRGKWGGSEERGMGKWHDDLVAGVFLNLRTVPGSVLLLSTSKISSSRPSEEVRISNWVSGSAKPRAISLKKMHESSAPCSVTAGEAGLLCKTFHSRVGVAAVRTISTDRSRCIHRLLFDTTFLWCLLCGYKRVFLHFFFRFQKAHSVIYFVQILHDFLSSTWLWFVKVECKHY
jgi:hypothetical protein